MVGKTRPRIPYPHEEEQDEPSLRALREGGEWIQAEGDGRAEEPGEDHEAH